MSDKIKSYIYYIAYGKDYYYLCFLDKCLLMFNNRDYVPNKLLYCGDDLTYSFNDSLERLDRDGFLIIENSGVRITIAGRRKISRGGFRRKAIISRLIIVLTIIGIIATILTFLFKLLDISFPLF